MSNNAAERAMKPPVLGRKTIFFCGSDAGGQRAACIYTITETCKMNGVEPQAYLTDILGCIADHPDQKDQRSSPLALENVALRRRQRSTSNRGHRLTLTDIEASKQLVCTCGLTSTCCGRSGSGTGHRLDRGRRPCVTPPRPRYV